MADDHSEHSEQSSSGAHGRKHGAHGGSAHEEHEGAPEWLISFADNVALMMGFFVILLAMNMAKPSMGGVGGEAKFPADAETPNLQDFALAMRRAFNNPVDINSNDPRESSLVKRLKERQAVGETRLPGPDGNKHSLQSIRPNLFNNGGGYITFPEASAEVDDESRRQLETIAEQVRGTRYIIEVRGHVSSIEAMRDKAHAMKLGFDRSLAAAEELVRSGLRWEQVRVVSCADNERATPLPNDKAGHVNNQRAEVVVTHDVVPPDPYAAEGSGHGE